MSFKYEYTDCVSLSWQSECISYLTFPNIRLQSEWGHIDNKGY